MAWLAGILLTAKAILFGVTTLDQQLNSLIMMKLLMQKKKALK
jgi:hypothetical protein